MSALKELRSQQEKLLHDARAELAKLDDDKLQAGEAAEIEARHDAIMADYDKIEARASRLEDLERRSEAFNAPDPRRPVGDSRSASGREQRGTLTTEDAFRSYLVHGYDQLTAEARSLLIRPTQLAVDAEGRNVQSVGTNSQGGFTVPTTLVAQIIERMKMWGPMLDPGVTDQVVTERGEAMSWPTTDDTSSKAGIVGENVEVVSTGGGANSPGALAFGSVGVGAFKYTAGPVRVSMELGQDSALNMEAVIRDAFATRFGRGVNEHLTVGAGTTQPWGIVTRSSLGYTNALSVAGALGVPVIGFDDMIELFHAVDPAYRNDPSVRWMFNDSTLKQLRKIKDLEGNYIWQPASASGEQPATILAKPYSVNQDMPALAFDAKPVVFGAFSSYIVRRVREVAIARLTERYAEFGQVGFIGFARFDGQLRDTNAVKHLVIPGDPS